MKVKYKFILFVAVIHTVLIIFSLQILDYEEKRILFLVAEALIICSLVISYKLYRSFIQPLELISLGVESIRSKDFNTKFLKVGHYELDQLVEMYNGMIDELRSERSKQQEQHFFLNRLIDASPMGVLILTFDQKVFQVNPAALHLLNLKEKDVLGNHIDRVSNELLKWISILGNEPQVFSLSNGKKYRCQKSYFIDQGFERYFIVFDEITKELMSSERESYEKIIRVMAHEVNNSTSAVNSILTSLKQFILKMDTTEKNDYEDAIDVSVERNKSLITFVKRYADFVKLPKPRLERNDYVALITSVLSLLEQRMIKLNIKYEFNTNLNECMKRFDSNLMEHVLINILKNSIESIGSNGLIQIELTSNALCIHDSGVGIQHGDETKLFTPFFTTKSEGNGIGLMLIRDVLMNHNYRFTLKTESKVTTFQINFDDIIDNT